MYNQWKKYLLCKQNIFKQKTHNNSILMTDQKVTIELLDIKVLTASLDNISSALDKANVKGTFNLSESHRLVNDIGNMLRCIQHLDKLQGLAAETMKREEARRKADNKLD